MDTGIDDLLQAGTAVVADAFDAMGLPPPVLDNALVAVRPGARFAGRAYTVAGESHASTTLKDPAKLKAIDAMPRGCVAVWAGNDIRGSCCFGDLLASAMKGRGCAGVVVDGGVRDVVYLRELGLPLFARYRTPAQALGRWRVTAAQVPVRLRGALADWVSVEPDDVVVADEDGVIVVPRGVLAEVGKKVRAASVQETEARKDILAGMKLMEALEKYGHL
jgi:regulator of RNase E activity RraA